MTDAAIQNAQARLAALNSERARLRQLLSELEADASAIESFIAEWKRWAGASSSPGPYEPAEYHAKKVVRAKVKNPPKEEVAEAAERVLIAKGRPLSRAILFDLIKAEGISLEGTDPLVVFSTMLWRMKDKVPYYKGIGYWPTSQTAPAGYRMNPTKGLEILDNYHPVGWSWEKNELKDNPASYNGIKL